MAKPAAHKYKKGDIVGIVSDCMADCRILCRLRKRDGQALSYMATAEKIRTTCWYGIAVAARRSARCFV